MKKNAFRNRILGMVAVVAFLSLLVASLGVPFPRQAAGQGPRPTPTTQPSLVLNPAQGVAGDPISVVASGVLPVSGGTAVIKWDNTLILASAAIASDGSFQASFTTPTGAGNATPGNHLVTADDGTYTAGATFQLIAPTPTHTPTSTPTSTHTPVPPTAGPQTPTNTAAPTDTPKPGSTGRPVTPIVLFGTPTRWSPPPATSAPTRVPLPTNTRAPTRVPPTAVPPTPVPPTSTYTPMPTDTSTPVPTSTPTPTPTNTPTSTPTPTPTSTNTPTFTPTPTDTPTFTPSPTDGAGTPVAAVGPTSTPGVAAGPPSTGGSWESIFFQGFIAAVLLIVLLTAFIVIVLVVLLVAWRIMRMRRAEEQLGG